MSSPMSREPLHPVGHCTVLDVAGDTEAVREILTEWLWRKLTEDPTPGATSQALTLLCKSAMAGALRLEVDRLKAAPRKPPF